MLVSLGVLVVVGALAATMATLVGGNVESHISQQVGNQAFFMAESGARYAIARLRQDGASAVSELDGRSFELANGWGFELDITGQDHDTFYRFLVESTGFVSADGQGQGAKHQLNSYQIDIPKEGASDGSGSPAAFPIAIQLTGGSGFKVTGSSYIDSYDSAVGNWTSEGQFKNAQIYSAANGEILDFKGQTHLYGQIVVPEGTDTSNPGDFVNRPQNVHGDPKVVTGPMPDATPIPPPEPPPLAPKPVSWDPYPDVPNWGTQTIAGGNYGFSGDYHPGSANTTVQGDLGLDAERDIKVVWGAGMAVNGDFNAWAGRDFHLGGSSFTVQGDANIQVGRNFKLTGSQQLTIDGDLDLSVDGKLDIDGNSRLHVKGDAYIDAATALKFAGSGKLTVEGKTIIRARDGIAFAGGDFPLDIGPGGSVQIFVDQGEIAVRGGVQINQPYQPERFLVFGSDQVTSVKVTGNGKVYGAIHAPAAELHITGSSEIFGAVVVDSVKGFSGNVALHYDEALGRLSPSQPSDPIPEQPLRRYWVAVGN